MSSRANWRGHFGTLMIAALAAVQAGCRDSQAAQLRDDDAAAQPAWPTALAMEEPAPGDTPGAAATIVPADPAPGASAAPAAAPTLTISAVGDCTLGSDYRITGA